MVIFIENGIHKEVRKDKEGYINNIEIGKSMPSLSGLIYICDYFGISLFEFFDTGNTNPQKLNELLDAAKHLSDEQLDNVLAIVKGLSK